MNQTPIKLLVGLRNPGKNYSATRHNAGEWFVHALENLTPITFKTEKSFAAEVGQFSLQASDCKVILPLTFMNHSGQPTRAVSQFYRISPEEILVAHDDLDLAPGCARLKTGGGHGGHNGLRDIIHHLGSPAFHRLRIGIGHPGHKDLVKDYALGKPSVHDFQQIQDAIARALEVLPEILAGNLALAMNQLNRN